MSLSEISRMAAKDFFRRKENLLKKILTDHNVSTDDITEAKARCRYISGPICETHLFIDSKCVASFYGMASSIIDNKIHIYEQYKLHYEG